MSRNDQHIKPWARWFYRKKWRWRLLILACLPLGLLSALRRLGTEFLDLWEDVP